MKNISFALILTFLLTTMVAQAAVTFTGSYASNLKRADGTTNITNGTRYVVIVDTVGDGFGASDGAAAGTLNVDDLFDGDRIIQTSVIGGIAGRAATAVSNLALDVAPFAGKQFALVWFSTVTGTAASDGDSYGFYRDSGWVLPTVVGATTLGFAATGSDFIQSTVSRTANLNVAAIPEPSRMILLGFGLVGVFFRRRR